MSRGGAAAATERLGGRGFPKTGRGRFPKSLGAAFPKTRRMDARHPGGAVTVQDDGGRAKTFAKPNVGEPMRDGAAGDELGAQRQRERLRRWNCHCADAGHRVAGQVTGGERSEPPGKGRAASVSERRGEGWPAEGRRPLAGSAWPARSRSDAPKNKIGIDGPEMIVGSIAGTCGTWSSCRRKRNGSIIGIGERAAAQARHNTTPEASY